MTTTLNRLVRDMQPGDLEYWHSEENDGHEHRFIGMDCWCDSCGIRRTDPEHVRECREGDTHMPSGSFINGVEL